MSNQWADGPFQGQDGPTATQIYLTSVLQVDSPQQGTPVISDPSEVILAGQTPQGTSFVKSL
jgi:hypothetical protein